MSSTAPAKGSKPSASMSLPTSASTGLGSYTAAISTSTPTPSSSTTKSPTLNLTSPTISKTIPISTPAPSIDPSMFMSDKKATASDHIVEILDTPPATLPHDPLLLFHTALGIPPPPPPKIPRPTKKNPTPPPAPPKPHLTKANRGIYHTVLSMERRTRYKYYFCDFILSAAMFLQIILGATLTAFGAGNGSHVLITVFGAANTGLASLMAVLKSQGLPNRVRQDWNGWRELREEIEEREREIEMIFAGRVRGVAGTEMELHDVWETVKTIERKYNLVRLTAEANRPDTYIKMPQGSTMPK